MKGSLELRFTAGADAAGKGVGELGWEMNMPRLGSSACMEWWRRELQLQQEAGWWWRRIICGGRVKWE